MALTKASSVLHNNATLTAGAGDTTTADQDISSSYRTVVRVRFTNGATGPSVQAQTKVQVSEDTTGANYMTLTIVYSGTTNSLVSEFVVEVPDTAKSLRLVSGSNTAQNVTIRAVLETITAV